MSMMCDAGMWLGKAWKQLQRIVAVDRLHGGSIEATAGNSRHVVDTEAIGVIGPEHDLRDRNDRSQAAKRRGIGGLRSVVIKALQLMHEAVGKPCRIGRD